MFERYSERGRRTIFFARYEASQYGCDHIEAEHILLGIFRADKDLETRFLPAAAPALIRNRVDKRFGSRPKIATSIDLPLSGESKRVLAYAVEESERFSHKHVGSEHLVLACCVRNRALLPNCCASKVCSWRRFEKRLRVLNSPPASRRRRGERFRLCPSCPIPQEQRSRSMENILATLRLRCLYWLASARFGSRRAASRRGSASCWFFLRPGRISRPSW